MNLILPILLGGLVAGTLDITYAMVAYGVFHPAHVPPMRILQSVAAGIWGRDAFNGGLPIAIAGGLLHFTMATMMAAAFVIASRVIPFLLRWPLITGILYGIALYLIMNYVVVPLSNSPGKPPVGWFLVGELMSHMFGVGVPIAYITKWFNQTRESTAYG